MKTTTMALTGAIALALSACGGGGGSNDKTTGSNPPSNTATGGTTVAAAAPTLLTASPTTGAAVDFSGGTCSGGQGQLTASWSFGDGSSASATASHTYQLAGTYAVTVTCTDASNATGTSSALSVSVATAASTSQGFLARTWGIYQAIDANNTSIYPIAAMSNDGVIQGLWLQNATTGSTVISGSKDAGSASGWSINSPMSMSGATVSYRNGPGRPSPVPMDLAVSPDGHALAAWIADSSIWYSTKTSGTGWTTPINSSIVPTDVPIKVVVDDHGVGAIGYCDANGAEVVTYTPATGLNASPTKVGIGCWARVGVVQMPEQVTKGFDLAIDGQTSTIYAVGIMPSATTSGYAAVTQRTYSAGTGWSAGALVSDEQAQSSFNTTAVSLSVSPNGQYKAVAWTALGSSAKRNAFARITNGNTPESILPLQSNNSVAYELPSIAINDSGHAFAVMSSNSNPYMVNYIPGTGWLSLPVLVSSLSGYGAVDVAIDQYGNGLVTLVDALIDSVAVTLSADGATKTSTVITPTYGYGDYHYQTLRALPDGRAVLVVSTNTSSGFAPSGYVVLK